VRFVSLELDFEPVAFNAHRVDPQATRRVIGAFAGLDVEAPGVQGTDDLSPVHEPLRQAPSGVRAGVFDCEWARVAVTDA